MRCYVKSLRYYVLFFNFIFVSSTFADPRLLGLVLDGKNFTGEDRNDLHLVLESDTPMTINEGDPLQRPPVNLRIGQSLDFNEPEQPIEGVGTNRMEINWKALIPTGETFSAGVLLTQEESNYLRCEEFYFTLNGDKKENIPCVGWLITEGGSVEFNNMYIDPISIEDLEMGFLDNFSEVENFMLSGIIENPIELPISTGIIPEMSNGIEGTLFIDEFPSLAPGDFLVGKADIRFDNFSEPMEFKWIHEHQLLVELINFRASYKGKLISLNWLTSSEINNAGFRLLRGIKNNAGNYEVTPLRELSYSKQINPEPNKNCSTKIQGQLKADNSSQPPKLISTVGNSAESTCYSFTDTSNLSDETYYYLLEDIDNNGNSTFHCNHLDAVTVGQGPAIDLESAINYCKEVTGSND